MSRYIINGNRIHRSLPSRHVSGWQDWEPKARGIVFRGEESPKDLSAEGKRKD